MDSTRREQVLAEALELVTRDRNEDYGDPDENLERIAHLMTWWLHERYGSYLELDTLDATMTFILIKVARLTNNTLHEDGWRDIVGYGAIGFELIEHERSIIRAARTHNTD